MTALLDTALTKRINLPVEHAVYVRRALAGYLPVYSAPGGWTYDLALRCDEIKYKIGAKVGLAKFTYIPDNQLGTPGVNDVPFEAAMNRYTPDDHVAVLVKPINDELVQQASNGDDHVLFEGTLGRHRIDAQADARGAVEKVRFVAQPFPMLDNDLTSHQITGRWVAGLNEGDTPFVVEARNLPAVFNFQGRPNMAPSNQTFSFRYAGADVTARLFTVDEDPDGEYWTVREAMKSLLGWWLYGRSGYSLTRSMDVEANVMDAFRLSEGPFGQPKFEGLDQTIGETAVQSRGVLDALQRVADKAGYDFAAEPREIIERPTQDRTYVLRIWRRNGGRVVPFKLDKHGTTYGSGGAEAALRRNNINKIVMMRDGSEVVNEVLGYGRIFIESRFELKPLWSPDDIVGGDPNPDMLDADKDRLANSGSYWAHHVAGGVNFKDSGHVGRLWGLDCIGKFEGYPSGSSAYTHGEKPFDFLAYLNGIGDGGLPDTEIRAKDGLPSAQWTKRLRQIMPRRSAANQIKGNEYFLQCSEDDGDSWIGCDAEFKVLKEFFGIRLKINNLAAVNNATLGTDGQADVASSWWKLIEQEQLRFRIWCSTPADHAIVGHALRQPSSGSRYPRGQVQDSKVDVTYIWTGTDEGWTIERGYSTISIPIKNPTTPVRFAAERQRDALEGIRQSIAASTWLMHWQRFRLGDAISGIDGREVSFQTNAGNAVRYPNIVAISYVLSPASAQTIRLSLADQALTGGV